MCYSLHLDIYSLEMHVRAVLTIDLYIWWKILLHLPRYKDYTLIDVGNFNVLSPYEGCFHSLSFDITGCLNDSCLTFFGL